MTTIKQQFDNADAARGAIMDRLRECAAYTIPTLLPIAGQSQYSEILRPYQSLGAYGLTNLVGKMLTALFPPNIPWFRYQIGPKIRSNSTQDDIAKLDDWLYARELQVTSHIESTGYRARMRLMVEHCLGLGTAIGRVMDDYSMRVYRLDNAVLHRSTGGDVLWVITHELLDPVQIDTDDAAKAQIRLDELEKKEGRARQIDLYTRCQVQRGGGWLVEQEINGHIIKTSEERVTPFVTPGYIEVAEEDWSRGFVEERLGDLRAYNGQSKAMLDGMTALAKLVPVADETKGYSVEDFLQDNGKPRVGRVNGGIVDGLAFLRVDKSGDFRVALEHAAVIEQRLGKQFLIETLSQPDGERVTAYQVDRIRRELEGGLGGVYANIAEELQRPYVERVIFQMEKDRVIVPIPKQLADDVDLKVLTGLEALGRQATAQNLLSALEKIAAIPGALDRLKMDVVVTELLKGDNIDLRAMVKSEDELAAERQAQMEQALQAQAGQQAIASAGKIAETTAR